jgi:hypothetical protein
MRESQVPVHSIPHGSPSTPPNLLFLAIVRRKEIQTMWLDDDIDACTDW